MKPLNLIAAIALVAIAAANTTNAQVIYTGEIAKKVIGYNGTTPLNITINKGKIERIEALPNSEDPAYLKRATKKIFAQYEGLTVAEAIKLKPDVATGATYTSEALIKNIQMGLQQASSAKSATKSKTPATKKTKKKARRR